MENCKIEGCNKPVIAKGMCWKHYRRMLRNGTLDTKLVLGIRKCQNPDCGIDLMPGQVRKGLCDHCYYLVYMK
jgi:hypothetical protein